MLIAQRARIASLSAASEAALRQSFSIPPSEKWLFKSLQQRHLTQADVVLVLLRSGGPAGLNDAEMLIGRAIEALPARECLPLPPLPRAEMTPDDRIMVLRVGPNPRLPTTPAFQRFKEFRPGRSVAQLLKRGVTRKDIREMTRARAVEFSS